MLGGAGAEGMDDADDDGIELMAREFVDRHGPEAIDRLREQAEIAAERGDDLAAEAWRDIIAYAERLLAGGWSP
jgi:hypothetical protein